MPYIDRYRDKHLSYYAELYTCKTVHALHIDKLMMNLEKHYLTVDRLYYHLIANDRLCCIDILLEEEKYPSTFCIVRAYKYKYETGKYIDEKLPLQIRAMVFNRMAERLILIRDIKRHIARYRPQLWAVYCMNSQWNSIRKYIPDDSIRTALDNIYRLTDNTVSNAYYKYEDIPNTMHKYESFILLLDRFKVSVKQFDDKIVPSSTIAEVVYNENMKNVPADIKEQIGDSLPAILMAVIFYHYAMKWAPHYSIDSISDLVEKALVECILSDV